jgi:DNA-binding NarL/FixJ family response regulator
MKRIQILLADDHDIVIEGLRRILDQPEFQVVAAVGDGRDLLKAAKEWLPDVIITDITMPLLNGIDAARKIRKIQPKTRIVFLTMHPDIGYAMEALSLGGSAYVLKNSAGDDLPEAIRAVMRGETFVSPKISGSVTENLRKRTPRKTQVDLSAREREILQLIAEGRTFKEIAAMLNISPRTVEFHRNKIADKTGRKTMADLTRYAVRIGIVTEKRDGGS